jgi:methylmalonyl-CoA mutase
MQDSATLFQEFETPSSEEWRSLVEGELEGADFNEKLVWKTIEGLDVQPLHFPEDTGKLEHVHFQPGFAPYVRDARPEGNVLKPWLIAQETVDGDPVQANAAIRKSLQAGQTALSLRFDTAPPRFGNEKAFGISAQCIDDFDVLLDGVPIDRIPVFLNAGSAAPAMLALYIAHAKGKGIPPGALCGAVEYDPLLLPALKGSNCASLNSELRTAASMISWTSREAPGIRTIGIDGETFHNAGATAVQELGFALSSGIEYLASLQEFGLSVDDIATSIGFVFAAGTNYFFEIAKLRAARMLWAKIVHHFSPADEHSAAMVLHARTSGWTKTIYDPHVNILRATIESMAAAIGGAQSLTTSPFDERAGAPSELSERLALNTQIVLREEVNLTKVIDPAGGSYYVEWLTEEIGRKAWSLVQEVDRRGGMRKALESGFVQDSIESAAAEKKKGVSRRRTAFVGTNQYPNLGEKPQALSGGESDGKRAESGISARSGHGVPDAIPGAHDPLRELREKSGGDVTTIFPAALSAAQAGAAARDIMNALESRIPKSDMHIRHLETFRGAEVFERIRVAVDAAAKKPKVFLATFGPAFQRRARATFSSGFLGCAGFEIIDNPGFENAEIAANAAVDAGADIVVACSDDDSYPAFVPELIAKLRAAKYAAIVIVAGYPKSAIDDLKKAGVDEFIHLRADAGAVLQSLLERLGLS